jgi:hypothetical protein
MAEYLGTTFGPRGPAPAPTAPVISPAAPATSDLDRQLREQADLFMQRKAEHDHDLTNQLEGQSRLHQRIEASKDPLWQQVARGVGHGALNVAPSLIGLPHAVDSLAHVGWNAVTPSSMRVEPEPPDAFGSSDWAAGALERAGHALGLPLDRPPPRSAMAVPERYSADFTENLGTALVPGLGWQKGAGALANGVRGIAESAGSVLGGEFAKGAGAGGFGEFLGNVLGGGAGRSAANLGDSLTGITARQRGAEGIADPSNPRGLSTFDRTDTYRAAGDLQAAVRAGGGDPRAVADRISTYIDSGDTDFGSGLTTGQGPVSGDPTLRSLDAWARRQDPPAFHAQDRAALNEAFGPLYQGRDMSVDPATVGREAERLRLRKESALDKTVSDAAANAAHSASILGRIPTPSAPDLRSAQGGLHSAVDDSRRAALARGHDLYADIPTTDPISGLDLALPLTPTGAQTLGNVARLPRHGDTPFADAVGRLQAVSARLVGDEARQYQALAKSLTDIVAGGEARISDLVQLDSGLGTYIERASRAQNPVLAKVYSKALADVKAGLRAEYDLLSNAPIQQGPGPLPGLSQVVGDQAMAAKKYWATDWSRNFGQGPGGAFDAGMRAGTQLPENAGRGFIEDASDPGAAAGALQLREILDLGSRRGLPKTRLETAVRDYLIRDLHESAGVKGITPAAIDQWSAGHRDILGHFPAVEAELAVYRGALLSSEAGAARSAERLRMAESDRAAGLRALARDPLSAIAGADGPHVVGAILSSKNPEVTIRSLMHHFKGNSAAVASLKRAVQDHIWRTTTAASTLGPEAMPSLAGLRTVAERHDNVLREILSPEEMSYLHRARNVATSLSDIKTAVPADIHRSATAGQGVSSVLQALLRYRFGILRTGGILKTMRDLKAGLGLGGELSGPVMDRLITQAMVDPQVAKTLLETRVDSRGFLENSMPVGSIVSGALRDNPDGKEMRDRPLTPFRAGDW